jgi:hypothetical protein
LGESTTASGEEEETSSLDKESNTVIFTPAVVPNQATLQVGDTLLLQIPTIPEEGFVWVADSS